MDKRKSFIRKIDAVTNAILDNVMDCACVGLKILRTIAKTPAAIPFDDVVASGDVWRLKLLLESGATVDDRIFQLAIERGNTDIVRMLLDFHPLADHKTAFQTACCKGHTEIVRMLLER